MNSSSSPKAASEFQKARTHAFWRDVWAKLRGQSFDLLNFEEVKERLHLHDDRKLGRMDIPLDKIVGSVGRYQDFNRKFLPRKSVSKERWQSVAAVMDSLEGFEPIEVYKIGDAYFVLDGNHRVSVARSTGMEYIEAYVTELVTEVPFDASTETQELFIKEGYALFLRKTNIKKLKPQSEIILTEPGRYRRILSHIEVHRYYLGLAGKRRISVNEAVTSWYDNVYTPMVEAIHRHTMLDEHPKRTEADLYVWLTEHQGAMHANYGGPPMSPDETVEDFMKKLDGQPPEPE